MCGGTSQVLLRGTALLTQFRETRGGEVVVVRHTHSPTIIAAMSNVVALTLLVVLIALHLQGSIRRTLEQLQPQPATTPLNRRSSSRTL